jgi:hypothetical protein
MKIGPLQINLRRLGIFIAVGILLVLVMDFNNRMEDLTRLQAQKATQSANATAVMVTQYALETRLAEATSAVAVEEYARDQARLAQPGDKVIIPLPQPGATPVPAPSPTPVFATMTKWEIWMIYLFGK